MKPIKAKVLLILVAIILLVIAGREIWQMISIKNTLDTHTHFLSRYLVAGVIAPGIFNTSEVQHRALVLLYNDQINPMDISPEYLNSLITNDELKENIQVENALLIAARYYSALSLIKEMKGQLPEPEQLTLVICSDRSGFRYDSFKNKCEPFDDAGEDGGRTIVSINYEYTIGSSLGLNLGRFNFHDFKELIIECTMVSCQGGLEVNLNGKVPLKYTIMIIGDNGDTRQAECGAGVSGETQINERSMCLPSGVKFLGFVSDKLTLTFKWDGGNYAKIFEPIYKVKYPNGLRCGGSCENGLINIELP